MQYYCSLHVTAGMSTVGRVLWVWVRAALHSSASGRQQEMQFLSFWRMIKGVMAYHKTVNSSRSTLHSGNISSLQSNSYGLEVQPCPFHFCDLGKWLNFKLNNVLEVLNMTIIFAIFCFAMVFFLISKGFNNVLKMIPFIKICWLIFSSLIRWAKSSSLTNIWHYHKKEITVCNFLFLGMYHLPLLSIFNVFQLNFKASSP